jgi:hypothetical protein
MNDTSPVWEPLKEAKPISAPNLYRLFYPCLRWPTTFPAVSVARNNMQCEFIKREKTTLAIGAQGCILIVFWVGRRLIFMLRQFNFPAGTFKKYELVCVVPL